MLTIAAPTASIAKMLLDPRFIGLSIEKRTMILIGFVNLAARGIEAAALSSGKASQALAETGPRSEDVDFEREDEPFSKLLRPRQPKHYCPSLAPPRQVLGSRSRPFPLPRDMNALRTSASAGAVAPEAFDQRASAATEDQEVRNATDL